MDHLNYILRNLGKKVSPRIKSRNSFRFDDVTVTSQWLIEIALDTSPNIPPIYLLMDLLVADIPALLGLDVLHGENFFADNVTNRLVRRKILSGP